MPDEVVTADRMASAEAALVDMPVMVARKAGGVVGYAVSSSLGSQAHLPIIQAMLRTYPGSPDAYIYGPV